LAARQTGYLGEISAAAMPLYRQKCGSRLDPWQRVDSYGIGACSCSWLRPVAQGEKLKDLLCNSAAHCPYNRAGESRQSLFRRLGLMPPAGALPRQRCSSFGKSKRATLP